MDNDTVAGGDGREGIGDGLCDFRFIFGAGNCGDAKSDECESGRKSDVFHDKKFFKLKFDVAYSFLRIFGFFRKAPSCCSKRLCFRRLFVFFKRLISLHRDLRKTLPSF